MRADAGRGPFAIPSENRGTFVAERCLRKVGSDIGACDKPSAPPNVAPSSGGDVPDDEGRGPFASSLR